MDSSVHDRRLQCPFCVGMHQTLKTVVLNEPLFQCKCTHILVDVIMLQFAMWRLVYWWVC